MNCSIQLSNKSSVQFNVDWLVWPGGDPPHHNTDTQDVFDTLSSSPGGQRQLNLQAFLKNWVDAGVMIWLCDEPSWLCLWRTFGCVHSRAGQDEDECHHKIMSTCLKPGSLVFWPGGELFCFHITGFHKSPGFFFFFETKIKTKVGERAWTPCTVWKRSRNFRVSYA